MKSIVIALCLIISGILIIVQGTRREDSVVGVADSVGTEVANVWDGKTRQPEHVWYYIAGGVLILSGLVTALRKKAA
ncbi:MAG: DUF3185 family protein [Cephaloticoccus sp.]|nr:DUF3185 family protein [Cephaloticoccus sp.]MCF7758976.1 DUF3185 family protein [Cephaloticoccus sp.]